ncbi:MAG: amidase [Acidimicrobiales bacterium]
MTPTAFPFGSATALVRALRRGQVSSVELLRAYLDRVDRYHEVLNAVVVDDRAAAMRQAKAADRAHARGQSLGPLHGLPMTVKEAFDLAGHPSTQGYPQMRDNVAVTDALAVQRLKRAGAVVFGKTNVPLNNGDFQAYNEIYGTTNNPWDTTRSPGGSSGGGAAAVAAGLVGLEYGSDIGGSIRNPAAYCGIYGHKTTWGIVPKRGHALSRAPLAEADLGVLGPLARSANDLDVALRATVGPDDLTAAGVRIALPPPPRELAGLRVALWLDQPGAEVDETVRGPIEAAATALRRAGARVNATARPAFDPMAAHGVYQSLLLAQVSARRPDHARLVEHRRRLADDDHGPAATQLRLLTPSFKEHYDQNQAREQLRWAWHEFFRHHDVLLAPITTTTAFPHDHSEPMAARTLEVDGRPTPYLAQLFWAGLATCCHLPATAAPVGLGRDGLPVGLQIIGPEMADRRTIWVAAQLERLVGGALVPPGFEG